MKTPRFRFIALLAIAAVLSACLVIQGCSQQQLQQAQTDLGTLQQTYAATTQQVTSLQADLDAARNQLDAAKLAATTQPDNANLLATIATMQKSVDQMSAALTAAQAKSQQVNAGIQTAQSLISAIQSGTPPNLSALGAFGPYGTLAGIGILLGWSVYSDVKHAGLLKTLNSTVAQATTPPAPAPPVASAVPVTGTPPNPVPVPPPAPAPNT